MTVAILDGRSAPPPLRFWTLAWLTSGIVHAANLIFAKIVPINANVIGWALMLLPASILLLVMRWAERNKPRSILIWIALGMLLASIYAVPLANFAYSFPILDRTPADELILIWNAVRVVAWTYGGGLLGTLVAWAIIRSARAK